VKAAALTLGAIVESLGGRLHGDATISIHGLAPLATAAQGEIAFLSNPRYGSELAASRASCVIVSPAMESAARNRANGNLACIIATDPYHYYAQLTQLWKRSAGRASTPGVHATAVVDASARIDPSATVGPLCVVEAGATVGAQTVLAPRVTIGRGCVVGARCIIHSGAVIGADGFGFAPHDGRWEKIEQLGAVRIGDDCEIGANTCIDRGALSDTVLEEGVKLDNLVQIGHNVHVGAHTAMAGCAGVAGSAHIGRHCTVGGGAVILGHLHIADHVNISASSTVMRSISEPGHYSGVFPIDDNAAWEKNAATLRQLHRLRERVRGLEKQLDRLTGLPSPNETTL